VERTWSEYPFKWRKGRVGTAKEISLKMWGKNINDEGEGGREKTTSESRRLEETLVTRKGRVICWSWSGWVQGLGAGTREAKMKTYSKGLITEGKETVLKVKDRWR